MDDRELRPWRLRVEPEEGVEDAAHLPLVVVVYAPTLEAASLFVQSCGYQVREALEC